LAKQRRTIYEGPKRIIGFKLTLEAIQAIKDDAHEADSYPAHVVERIVRDYYVRKGRLRKPEAAAV
jgi:hypothetical protein